MANLRKNRDKTQIMLREKSRCEFAMAVSRETAVLVCIEGARWLAQPLS